MFFLLLHKDGTTALFKAALKGQNSVVEELLKFSPSLGLLKVGYTTCPAIYNIFPKVVFMHVLIFLFFHFLLAEWLHCPPCCCYGWKSWDCSPPARGSCRPQPTQQGGFERFELKIIHDKEWQQINLNTFLVFFPEWWTPCRSNKERPHPKDFTSQHVTWGKLMTTKIPVFRPYYSAM